MTGMNGDEFFAEAVLLRPDLADRFLFATGTIDPAEIARLESLSTRPVLQKPFSVSEVHERILELVDDLAIDAASVN